MWIFKRSVAIVIYGIPSRHDGDFWIFCRRQSSADLETQQSTNFNYKCTHVRAVWFLNMSSKGAKDCPKFKVKCHFPTFTMFSFFFAGVPLRLVLHGWPQKSLLSVLFSRSHCFLYFLCFLYHFFNFYVTAWGALEQSRSECWVN